MESTRTLVAGLFITLDGVVEAPEKWHLPYHDDEMDHLVGQWYSEADTLLMGRVTYETFAAAWPDRTGPMADTINGMRKVVASTAIDKPDWHNTTLLDGDLIAATTELARQPGRTILLQGSISLVRALLAANLLDELRLLIHPLVLGGGARLFPAGTPEAPLTLVRSTALASGVLNLTYAPV
ncbi:dihydrofolate reductase family protein [Nocardia sp. CC227C]|uniref:dihydrofolate reductase family protein n=1 Tax=Nocardia sp. CC227C TaxID=3044562 RepID=UPI00278C6A8C|nr:dihydrofolate reductase family protein [Nocardia sp. CC227C]